MTSNQHHQTPDDSAHEDAETDSSGNREVPERQLTLRDRIIPFSALGVVIVLIGVLGYTLYTPSSSSLGAGGRVNSSGSMIELGERHAPGFQLQTFDGEPVSLADFEGKSVVINFWSSWCPPCRDEAPILNDFHEYAQERDDVVLLGIAIWDRREDAVGFMNQYNLSFTNLNDASGSVLIDYGVYGVPETYFIGPDGTLLGKFNGPLESAEHIEELRREFEESQFVGAN